MEIPINNNRISNIVLKKASPMRCSLFFKAIPQEAQRIFFNQEKNDAEMIMAFSDIGQAMWDVFIKEEDKAHLSKDDFFDALEITHIELFFKELSNAMGTEKKTL